MLRSKISVAVVIFLMLSITVIASPVWAEQADAAAAITSAQNTILNCYSATKEAEASGANITVLVDTLNEAGELLSQAEYAYATNDFDTALTLATQSQNILSNVIEDAKALQETATQQQNTDFLINVVGSILGAFAVVAVGFVVWFFLKRKYEKARNINSESPRV